MSDTEQLLVTLGVQDKGANKQISSLNKELKNLDKQYKSAASTSKDFDKSQEGLTAKLNILNQKFTVNEAKLTAYKEKIDSTKDAIAKKEAELEKLNSAEEVNGKAVSKAEEQLSRMKTTLRDTENNVQLTENEMQRLTNEINNTNTALKNHALDEYKEKMKQTGEAIQQTGDKISKTGQVFSATGASLMKISAPMIAFSGYAAKVSIDFQQAMANLQATSGATGDEFIALEDKAKELGENTCKSATDSANAMQYLALAGYDVNTILASTEPVLKASVAWGADMATSADLATDSMSALGMSTDRLTEYLDVCSQAQRSSNTTATMLMEAYIGCGGTLKTLGVPLQESATWLGILANQGKKGAEAGNNLNSILVNLVGGSSTAKGAMDTLGVSAWDSNGKFIGLTNTMNLLKSALSNCTQEQKTNFQAAIGGKTQLDTLNMLLAGCGDQYDNLRTKIDDATGATEEMYDIMNNTSQGKIEAFKSKCEALGIKIGDELLPHINDLIDKGMELIDWFSNLDQGTQEAILKFGLLTFTTGGLLSATGKMVTNIGGLTSWIGKMTTSSAKGATEVGKLGGIVGKVTTGFGLLKGSILPVSIALAAVGSAVYLYKQEQESFNNSVLTSKEDMGYLEAALLSLNGVQVKSRQELEDSGLVYKEFSGNISDNFKKAVQDMTTDIHNFAVELGEISLDGVLSDDETTNFTNRVSGAVQEALEAVSTKKAQIQDDMQGLFTFDDGVIDDSEQAIIDLCKKEYDIEAEEVQKNQDAINQIYNQARTEGRALTDDEIQAIKKYYGQIKQIELECKAENQDELQYSTIDFNNRIKNLDAQGASDLLVQKKSELNDQLIEKENEYDQIIQKAKEGAANLQGAEKEEADSRIEQLKQKKQECIDEYQDQWQKYIDIVDNECPNISDTINKYTGEILSDADLKAQQGFSFMQSHFDGLNQVAEEGWYSIYNTTTQTMDDCYMTVDENTGEITACWDSTSGECSGYTEAMKDQVKALGEEHETQKLSITQSLGEIAGASITASGEMVDAMGNTISQLYNVEDTSNGTISAIVNLNGTPVQIETNSDGVILSMHQVGDSMGDVSIKAGQTSEEVASKFQGAADRMPGIGQNIDNGIGAGIDSNKGGLFAKIGALCSGLLDAAKSALGIHSPSRKMRDIIGKNIIAGIRVGMDQEAPELLNYCKTTSYKILDAFKDNTDTDYYKSYGSELIDSIKEGFDSREDSALKEIEDFVNKQVEALKEANPKAKTNYSQAGKALTNAYKEALKSGFDDAYATVKDNISKISEEAQEQYKNILDMQKNMKNKLLGYGDLFTTNDDEIELSNIGDQSAMLEKYENRLNKLKKKGVSDDFISQVTDMNVETAIKFMDKLYKLDDKQFKNYINSWNNKQLKAKEISDRFYQNQLTSLQENFTKDIDNAMSGIPGLMKNVGSNAAIGMLNGLTDEEGNLIAACDGLAQKMISTFESAFDIHSPSRVMKNRIGKNIVKGINVGIDDEFGNLNKNINSNVGTLTDSLQSNVMSLLQDNNSNIDFTETGLNDISDKIKSLLNINKVIDLSSLNSINNVSGNLALAGGYYNENSLESARLINSSSITNNYGSGVDYDKISDSITNAVTTALENISLIANVNVDTNGIVNKSVNTTLKRIKKDNRSNELKGR